MKERVIKCKTGQGPVDVGRYCIYIVAMSGREGKDTCLHLEDLARCTKRRGRIVENGEFAATWDGCPSEKWAKMV